MPHVNIKHFPVSLSEEQQAGLAAAITQAVKTALQVRRGRHLHLARAHREGSLE